ncbi:hypothetical protein WJX64_13780 [Leifsonia sp. YIM 134122]|uniref:Uncharacterized protein n=1 Tax=Leifsonia stereocauli TaxID=3134136 RepID=A0ABU9W6J4_9MICO
MSSITGASQRPLSDTFDALVMEPPYSHASGFADRAASAGLIILVAPLLVVVALFARLLAFASGSDRR